MKTLMFLLLLGVTAVGCKKDECATCVTTTRYYPILNTIRDTFTVCGQDEIEEWDGKTETSPSKLEVTVCN